MSPSAEFKIQPEQAAIEIEKEIVKLKEELEKISPESDIIPHLDLGLQSGIEFHDDFIRRVSALDLRSTNVIRRIRTILQDEEPRQGR